MPYDNFSPHPEIISDRLSALYQLSTLKKGILIAPMMAAMQRLCPKNYLLQHLFLIKKGDSLSLKALQARLSNNGYQCTSQVKSPGEFAVRGALLDFFPVGSALPYRIDFFDDEVDSLRTFDVDSQRSLEQVNKINILPAQEYPLAEPFLSIFKENWRHAFPDCLPNSCPHYTHTLQKEPSPGIEFYLPLFFETLSTLFDYLPPSTLILTTGDLTQTLQGFWDQIRSRHEQYRGDSKRPLLEPAKLFLPPEIFFGELKKFPCVQFQKPDQTLPAIAVDVRAEAPLLLLQQQLQNYTGKVLFCVESKGRLEVLKTLLSPLSVTPKEIENWQDFLKGTEPYGITLGPLEAGLRLEDPKIWVITETELLGRRVQQRRHRKRNPAEGDNRAIRHLAELAVGDPVVHLDYGIGRYAGLVQLTLSDQTVECVALDYLDNGKLYLPVSALHLIHRYNGATPENAPWHRLGGTQWQKAKQKAAQKVGDVAAELLEIYAKRAAKPGFAFTPPDLSYQAFCAGFPFEETPDQMQAIQEVLRDLASKKPMDRVICGDVGFGKTEVALRAAFIAASSGKQVALLVPTTLLAQQHYQTFQDRFAGFPIQVGLLSRFRTKAEQRETLDQLKAGTLDIVIGTHQLLQKGIQFKALGLLIIDEEHRFGVRQKESFKALRSEIDILTLTATPIPRTLNMAFSGLRDLSIISTPPAKRRAIKTFVREYDPALIREAIQRELHRGGQVYFVHNSVETIHRMAEELQQLVPEAQIHVAHGQMNERELEQVMSDFYHRRFTVLVCTTIIETGIDVPTANTLLIHRADKLGLSQLHQLRGRVGRSHHQAYAFCLIPKERSAITPEAEKRLEALANFEELGSGFTLATHDLEIRGAGELLGDEQSGQMQEIGFELYMDLLNKTVSALQSGKLSLSEITGAESLSLLTEERTEINLRLPAFIPTQYLPDIPLRLLFYKRIAEAGDKTALFALEQEMEDRFGPLPQEAKFLFDLSEIKALAQKVGISKIEAGNVGGKLHIAQRNTLDVKQMIALLQEEPALYKLDKAQHFCFTTPLGEPNAKIAFVKNLIARLFSIL